MGEHNIVLVLLHYLRTLWTPFEHTHKTKHDKTKDFNETEHDGQI